MRRFTNFKSSPHTKDHHKYEMSGMLLKMGQVNKSWKERFFILEDDKLFYYKNHDAVKAIAYIPLNDAYVRVSPEYYPEFASFEIVTCQRIYKLQAANFELMKTWIQHCQTFSKITMENELIRQADIQIYNAETKYARNLLEELQFEPCPLDNFYFTCLYNMTQDDRQLVISEDSSSSASTSIVSTPNANIGAATAVITEEEYNDENLLQLSNSRRNLLDSPTFDGATQSIIDSSPLTRQNEMDQGQEFMQRAESW